MQATSQIVPCKVRVQLCLAVGGAVGSPSKLRMFPLCCSVDACAPQGEEADRLGWAGGKDQVGYSIRLRSGGRSMWDTPPEGRGMGCTGCSLLTCALLFSVVL